MIGSILLALDDTPGAMAARDLAFAIARFLDMTDSMLVRGAAFLAGGVSVFIFNRLIAARLRREGSGEAKDGR